MSFATSLDISLQTLSGINVLCVIALIALTLLGAGLEASVVGKLMALYIAFYFITYAMCVLAFLYLDHIAGINIYSLEGVMLKFNKLVYLFPALPIYVLYICLCTVFVIHRYIRLAALYSFLAPSRSGGSVPYIPIFEALKTMGTLVVKNTQYSQSTFDYIKSRSNDIEGIAAFFGISPASVIGGIANNIILEIPTRMILL